jgi:hypothetical protein
LDGAGAGASAAGEGEPVSDIDDPLENGRELIDRRFQESDDFPPLALTGTNWH